MTERVFRLSEVEFFLLWQAVHRDAHPVPLGTRHFGHTQAERARLVESACPPPPGRGEGPRPPAPPGREGAPRRRRAVEVGGGGVVT
ncbi:ESX secretion-associated protein EspG, partial [Saccharothrix sp. MB29]|nr:ESX secretion-associated protein EspG [Saccharothrix sp. MB29]